MERPEVVDPLKEEEQPILQQTPVEDPKPVETQTDDAFSVRSLAEKRFGEIGTSALDFVPIVGDVLAAGDVVESARKGDVLGTAINVAALGVGLVPIVGDLAAKGLKQGLKKYEKVSTTNKDVIDTPVKDAAEIGDPAEVIALKGANRTFLSKQKRIDKGEKVFDDLDSLIADAKKLPANAEKSDDVISWEVQSKRNQEGYRKETGIDVVSRTEPLEQAALKYYDKVEKGGDPVEARLEYLEILEKLKPIREWDDIPLLTSPKQQVLGLNSAQRKSGKFIDVPNKDAKELEKILGHPLDVIKLNKGQVIEGRLDISAYKTYNAWITTLSGTGIKGQIYGDALHYVSPEGGKVVFKAREELARNILTRQPLKVDPDTGEVIRYYDKTPFGVIRGAYNPMSPKEVRQKVKKLLKDPEWTQVGFDPRRLTTFYTRSNRDKYDVGSLVESADEVFQIGPLVLAKNIKLIDQAVQPRLNKGGVIKTYKEGGVVPMGQQMEMAFMNEGGVLADDGVERDPVSGNEVPAGSMAEEVRDDVPAMLSEGEYVVPADVVRYHGIDKFEELRDEAKMGLSRMEADGRIGGQPVEEQEEFPFSVEELEGFNEGGAVGDTYSSVTGSEFKANQPYGAGGGRFPGVGFELRNFTDPNTGRTVVIPFFNGRPMQYIPPNFLEGGAPTTGGGTFDPAADERSRQEDEAERARQGGQTGLTPLAQDVVNKIIAGESTRQQGKSFDKYTSEDWNNYIRNAESKTADITSKIPIIGNLQRMSEKAARSFAMTALRSGKNPATEQPLSQEEKLTLEKVLTVAPNTSMTEALINAVTGKGETIQGLPLTEQAGFEFGKAVRQGDVMVKPVTKLPDDLLPDLSSFKEAEPTGPFYKAGETDAAVTEQDLPPAEYFGPSGEFQNIIDPQKTVAEQAQEIIEYAWVVVPGVNLNKKFRVNKRDLHLVGASPNDSARAILATDKHGIFDPVLRKTTGKGNLIQVHSEGPEGAKVLSRQNLARYSGADVNANASDVQDIIETNDSKVDKNKRSFINSLKNAFDMSAGAATPTSQSILTGTGGDALRGGVALRVTPNQALGAGNTAPSLITNALADLGLDSNTANYGAILSKTAYESNNFNTLTEDLTYRTGGKEYKNVEDRLRAIFPTKLGNFSNKQIQDLNIINNPENFGNYIYDGVNGNTEVGDGFKYRGRGYVQLTGRENYQNVGNKLGVDLENMSEQQLNNWFSSPQNSANATAAFFAVENDKGRDLTSMTSINRVVGGANQNVKIDPKYANVKTQVVAKLPPKSPFETGTAVAQPQDVSQFYGQRFDPSKIGTAPIDTDDMLKQAAQNIPAGSDIGPSFQNIIQPQQQLSGFQNIIEPQVTTPEYFGPSGFQNIIQPQVTTPKLDVDVPQSNLPFVQGPPVAPTVGLPPTSPATAQDMQTQEAFGVAPEVAPPVVSEPGGLGQVSAKSGTLPFVQEAPTKSKRLGLSPGAMGGRQPLGMSPGAMGGRAAPTAPTPTAPTAQADDQPDTPKLKDLKQRQQTRDAANKSKQMTQARQDVFMATGDYQQAEAAAQAVFLDQSTEIKRNQRLSERVSPEQAAKQGGYPFRTLTDVLEEEERESSGGGNSGGGGGSFGGGSSGGSDKSIVCTEIYRQTQLADWSKAMRVWDTYQRRYLTIEHEIGYHWLFRPYVSGMKKSNLLTRFGALMAGRRTQHLKHVLTKGKAKDDLFGNVFCKVIHPTVYIAGKIKNFLDSKTKAT